MALRAGYYGIKRKIKNKLENVAANWDNLIDTQLVNTVSKVYKTQQTIAGGATASVELPTITGKHIISISCGSRGAGAPVDFNIQLSSTTDDLGYRVVNIKNTSATERTRTYTISCIYMDDEYIEQIDLDTSNKSIVLNTDEIDEPVVEKKTTRKKSTAKAETTEEV